MSALFASPPEPPSPYATAGAQTGTNVSTAVANSYLNNVNQVTPQGNLTYGQTGTYSWQDPVSMATYNIPQFTATQSRTPIGEITDYNTNHARRIMSEMAFQQSGALQSHLSAPMNFSDPNLHEGGDPADIGGASGPRYDIEDAGGIQRDFGDAGEITRSYGPEDNYSADRQRVEEALFQRVNPQLQFDEERLRQQLADQGIRYGSPAYHQAMADQSRRVTDTRLGVTAAGGTEQQRLNQMDAQRAAFENSAQGQAYQQLLGRGTFANEAQQQQFGQNAARTQAFNAATQQRLAQMQSYFNASQARRASQMNEMYARANQPLQQINALMSGSQVQNPNFVNAPSSQIPVTDVAGIINRNYDQQSNNFNSQQQSANALVGGLMGMGANIYRSDERTKKNIRKVGTVFSTNVADKPGMGSVIGERKQLPIYEYAYKDDPDEQRHVGPMAQDVEKIDKGAVLHDREGTKYIDRRRVIGGILRAA